MAETVEHTITPAQEWVEAAQGADGVLVVHSRLARPWRWACTADDQPPAVAGHPGPNGRALHVRPFIGRFWLRTFAEAGAQHPFALTERAPIEVALFEHAPQGALVLGNAGTVMLDDDYILLSEDD